jgi:hypothetical protein
MTTASGAARRGLSRAVVFTGIALGTFVTVTGYVNGYRPPASGLAALLAGVITWVLLAVLAVTVIEVLRRHHRAIGRHGWRYGKRGATAAARRTRNDTRSAIAWLAAKAAPRWEQREHRPLLFARASNRPASPSETKATTDEGTPMTSSEKCCLGANHCHCPADCPCDCGPCDCSWSRAQARAAASKIAPGRRARRAAARTGGSVPAEWGPVIAQAADFEPEDDGELLEWMTRQVTGLSGWAEALVDFYEHCTQVIGIDPQASAMLHDVADAAAQAAETMGAAKAKFTEHYELPREFAANGGLMTHDGRWVTGEGA